MPRCALLGVLTLAALPACRTFERQPWPQFRGPNASGIASSKSELPLKIGPERSIVWKSEVPPGHSSPVVADDRIYLTAARDGTLLTMALDRATGKLLWEQAAPADELEEIHKIGSHAQPSPATDGEIVVSFFGSSGLHGYRRDGELLWSIPMGPFKNNFGAGSSPLIAGDRVILAQDHDTGSFIMAVDKRTGDEIWKTDRSEFPRGFATPTIVEVDGKKQIVVAGTLRLVGYDFETGKELWTVREFSRIACMTPVAGDDGRVYAAGYAPGGGETDRIEADPWEDVIATHDADANGVIQRGEVPEGGDIGRRFDQIDRDKSGEITKEEYEDMRVIFHTARNVLLAVDPSGEGDVTTTHVAWRQTRHIPYVPSPLYYDGHLYLVRNGGIFASLDAGTGELVREDRIEGRANYYASPVVGDGKIYLLSQRGELSVVSSEPEWELLWSADFDSPCYATPAIAGDRIYLRTHEHLYAFGADGEDVETETAAEEIEATGT